MKMKRLVVCSLLLFTIPLWGPFYVLGLLIAELWSEITNFYQSHFK